MNGLLRPTNLAQLPETEAPILLVVVDTEEEFDWSKPHARAQTAVSAMGHINVGQEVFDKFGVAPCYVLDYPIVSQREGFEPLGEIHASGRCSIGAHLHPWVNPPYDEEVTARNSYPGNLPASLEREKLKRLKSEIAENLDVDVKIYKAGRYGIGENSETILEDLGFTVDLSAATGFDYSNDGGPDFSSYPNNPFWFGKEADLLSIPCTGGLVGFLSERLPSLYQKASSEMGQRLRVPGILSRCRALERIRLSPEGYDLSEMIRLTEALLARGVRVLTLSFHSPSLKPGCTPYVRNDRDLSHFLDTITRYLMFFFEEKRGRNLGPLEIREHHLSGRGG
jgi:hypothetical protein